MPLKHLPIFSGCLLLLYHYLTEYSTYYWLSVSQFYDINMYIARGQVWIAVQTILAFFHSTDAYFITIIF